MAYQLQDLEEASRGLENVGVEGETHAAVLERKSKKIFRNNFPNDKKRQKNWIKNASKQNSMAKRHRGISLLNTSAVDMVEMSWR